MLKTSCCQPRELSTRVFPRGVPWGSFANFRRCAGRSSRSPAKAAARKPSGTEAHERAKSTKVAAETSKPVSYASTLNLPTTSFPMFIKRGEKRMQHERHIREQALFDYLYELQRKRHPRCADKLDDFVLHDGPPYANGPCHIGHAVNKIIKDIHNRYAVLSGKKLHYVPGWDCHGLPIEHMALNRLRALHAGNSKPDAMPIRNASYEFAKESIARQCEGFRNWAVLADWKQYLTLGDNGSTYVTYSAGYEAMLLGLFYKLYERGLISRSSMPVYWSPSSRTALAEAELEYNEKHASTTVVVKFKLTRIPSILQRHVKSGSDVSLLIWTTTPWSLVANQAVCYSNSMQYVMVNEPNNDNDHLIIAKSGLDFTAQETKWSNTPKIIAEFPGSALADAAYIHPIAHGQRELPLLYGAHVAAGKGTGLVHCAPNHGHEDYLVFLEQNLPLAPMLVDEAGRFDSTFDKQKVLAPDFVGKNVLSDGNYAVIDHLRSVNTIVAENPKYIHSYPYDWRTKQPVIIRSSPQWFFSTKQVLPRALEVLERDVRIVPEKFKPQLANMLMQRPYWCISRQRSWGTPIPVFYVNENDAETAVCTRKSVDHLRQLFLANGPDALNGSNVWWEANLDQLLSRDIRERYPNLRRGNDILDIWFESGATWHHVLPVNRETGKQIADDVVEGVDQIGAWFQTSLLLSVALQDCAPYRNIYVHGFVLDAKGRKMSKSLGNVVDPNVVVESYGADVLRLLVARHAEPGIDLTLSPQLVDSCEEVLRKWRNTMRFLLGTIDDDFDFERNAVRYDELLHVDQYMLHKLRDFVTTSESLYSEKAVNRLVLVLLPFMTSTLSSFYFTAIKDRLYCDEKDSVSVRSAKTVLWQVLWNLNTILAPILPHLTEECFATYLEEHDQWDWPRWNRGAPFLIQSWHLDKQRQRLLVWGLGYHDPNGAPSKRPIIERLPAIAGGFCGVSSPPDETAWEIVFALRDEINRLRESNVPSLNYAVALVYPRNFSAATQLLSLISGNPPYTTNELACLNVSPQRRTTNSGHDELSDILQVSQSFFLPAEVYAERFNELYAKEGRQAVLQEIAKQCGNLQKSLHSLPNGVVDDRCETMTPILNKETTKTFRIPLSGAVSGDDTSIEGVLFKLDESCRCARCRKLSVVFEGDSLCSRCSRIVRAQIPEVVFMESV